MTKVAVFGAGSWGTAFSLVLADAGHEVTIWGRRPEVCDAINTKRENTDYLPGITLPDARPRHRRPRGGGEGRRARRAGRPLADTARQPRRLGRRAAARRHPDVADEGRRARHPQAHERGHRGGDRRRPRADRRADRAQPGPRDRRPGAGRQRRGLRLRAGGRPAARVAARPALPALLQRRRRGLRARRRLQERHRPRGRHGRRAGVRRQHHRLAHHPRAGRDRAAGGQARCRPVDAHGPGRAWATSSPPAPRRCRATAPSARSSARA